MVNTTFNADGVIFTFVSLGAAHSGRTATATVKCRKHQTSIGQALWAGSWSSGSKEVVGVSKYTLLAITAVDSNNDATKILAVIDGTRVTGIGGVQLSSTLSTVGFVANLSGDTLSFVRCKTMSHNTSANHGGIYDCRVTQINGIA